MRQRLADFIGSECGGTNERLEIHCAPAMSPNRDGFMT